jgi:hypothetical protein
MYVDFSAYLHYVFKLENIYYVNQACLRTLYAEEVRNEKARRGKLLF